MRVKTLVRIQFVHHRSSVFRQFQSDGQVRLPYGAAVGATRHQAVLTRAFFQRDIPCYTREMTRL